MKLKKNVKLIDLLSSAKLCKEDVFYKTEQGDVLNLKSLLSTLLLQSLTNDRSLVADGRIVCVDEEDYEVLADLLDK